MYDKILIPIAKKINMKLIIDFVEDFLNPGGEITLLYVITSDRLPVSAVDWRQAMSVISKTQAMSLAKDLNVSYKVKNNRSVARGILEEAEAASYDLILLASPRERQRRKPLFGSKIDEVVRGSHVETVVLTYPDDRPIDYRKILVPTSGYRHALRATKIAEVLAKKVGGEVTTLYVGSRKEEADAVLAPLVSDLEANGVRCSSKFVTGPVAPTILGEAEKGYGLMMIGATERPAIQEFILGSTADSLIRDSPCPVLMVKTPAKMY